MTFIGIYTKDIADIYDNLTVVIREGRRGKGDLEAYTTSTGLFGNEIVLETIEELSL